MIERWLQISRSERGTIREKQDENGVDDGAESSVKNFQVIEQDV